MKKFNVTFYLSVVINDHQIEYTTTYEAASMKFLVEELEESKFYFVTNDKTNSLTMLYKNHVSEILIKEAEGEVQ